MTFSDQEVEALDLHDKRKPLSDSQMSAFESAMEKRAKLPKPGQGTVLTKTLKPQPQTTADLDVVEKPKDRSGLFSDAISKTRSALQGATGGFADELVSAGETAAPSLSSWENLARKFRGEPVEGKSYVENRAENRKVYDQAVKDNPGSNLVGSLAMPVPGSSTVKGAMAVGAGVGALNALGNSTADLTKGEYGKAALDTGIGGGSGALVGGTLGKMFGPKSGEALEKTANIRALKATGAIQKDLKKLTEEEQQNLGQSLLKNKLIGWFDKAADVGKKVESKRQAIGSELGKTYDALDAKAGENGFDVLKANQGIYDKVTEPLLSHPEAKQYAPYLEGKADDLLDTLGEKVPFKKANEVKTGYDDFINHARQSQKTDTAEMLKRFRNGLRDEINTQAEGVDPKLAENLKGLNKNYGNMAEAQDLAKAGMDRDNGNNFLGSIGKLTAAMGLASGLGFAGAEATGHGHGESGLAGGAGGVLAGVLTTIASQRGDAFAANLTNVLSKVAQNPKASAFIQEAAKRGPNALMSAAYLLQKQFAPEAPSKEPKP